MKPVFRCDYCSFIGTEEEVNDHEPDCTENYDKKSCYTCKGRGEITFVGHKIKYQCLFGKDVPAGNIFQYCDCYKQKEKLASTSLNNKFFGSFF